ncbi:MAG: patatin-like phospholipase family protein [Pseudomonadota bacterium]
MVKKIKKKTALLLGGGGVTGGVFEIGCIKAINDFITNKSLNDFDIFIGTSAGSIIATCLAFNISPEEIYKSLEGKSKKLSPLRRRDFYRPNIAEVAYKYITFPNSFYNNIKNAINTKNLNPMDFLASSLYSILPSGLFTTKGVVDYLNKNVIKNDKRNDFKNLAKELYIPSCNLDTGERVVFGDNGYKTITITKAVEASIAFPFLYKPVRYKENDYVDGAIKRTVHLDVAIKKKAELLICINPIAPFKNIQQSGTSQNSSKDKKHISQTGIINIVDQAFRAVIHSRTQMGIAKAKRENPNLKILMFEPKLDDITMFAYHMMRYDAREKIAKYSYNLTVREINNNFQKYYNIFKEFGFILDNSFISRNKNAKNQAGENKSKGSLLSIL